MTEELEIIIDAKVEEAVREIMKLVPAIKQITKQIQDTFSRIDAKTIQNKLQQTVRFMKEKIQDLKKSTQNSEIAIKVNNKDAQKQITQIQKQIDSLQQKVTQETSVYHNQLNEAKNKMTQLKQEVNQAGVSQNKMTNFFSAFKGKLDQAKPSVNSLKNVFNKIPKLTQHITNNIKNMASGIKQGLGHVIKYASSLFSLRNIYSVLSNCASTWLSSQNAGAKQLSANIDYMKYAMGSAFVPVIQWVTNLIYNLMKAIQSIVYALFRVNIFANASAKSYGAMAGNAKKAKEETKQLAGIHDEINNIQSNDNLDSGNGGSIGTNPSFDLSNVNPANSIADAIRNGDWYQVGALVGEKINSAIKSIDWNSIQNTAKNIAINIGNFINGFVDEIDWTLLGSTIGNGINTVFISINTLLTTINWGEIGVSIANFLNFGISTTDWTLIGTTFANGLNAIIHFGYNFVTTFNWIQFGMSIGQGITTFIQNIDWATAGNMLGEGIKGIFNFISFFLNEIDWSAIGEAVKTFIQNIDWIGIWNAVIETIKSVIGSVDELLTALFGENTATVIEAIAIAIGAVSLALAVYNIAMGVAAAVTSLLTSPITIVIAIITVLVAAIIAIAKHWDEVSSALSIGWVWIQQKAMEIFMAIAEFFSSLWQGICLTVTNIWNGICEFILGIWNAIRDTAVLIFNGIKDNISNVFNAIKDFIVNIWNGIVNTISNVWNMIVAKVTEGVLAAWNAITSVFGGIANWFGNIFRGAWEAVKNVFSTGGSIFNGIKDGILNGLKTIVNAIINGINRVIAIPFNGINAALRAIRSVNIMGLQPFSWISTIGVPQIPTLAKGGVLTQRTMFIGGEYSGASSNPEIVTPQNIMRETMEGVFSKYQGNNSDRPIYLTVNVNNKKLGQILIDDLRDMKRQTGNGLEALVGG